MRSIVCVAAILGIAFPVSHALASANSYPDRAVRIVVPYPPGGGTDNTARLIAEHLGKALGQTVVIENRAGANGTIGANHVANANPDGYTLLFSGMGPLAVNASITESMPYDSKTAFEPIINVSSAPMVIAVHPEVPVQSISELIDYGKAKPDELFAGNAGNGSPQHICTGLFAKETETPIQPVAYKGAAPALTDLAGGVVQMTCENVGTIHPFVKSDRVRALAVTSSTRSELLPEVPTLAEAGVDGVDFTLWFMLVAPAGTPKPIVDLLNERMNVVLTNEEVIERLKTHANVPEGGTVGEAKNRLERENQRWLEQGEEIGLTRG